MRRIFALVVAIITMAPGALVAQHDSVLALAVRRATEGYGDSARAMVRARLRSLQPTDSTYAEALYAAGIVAASTDSAVANLRRVSVEFSQSSWADDALLRLGQLAFAAGDMGGALRSFDRILTDYPLSDVRAEAQYWSGRLRLETGDAAGGCQRLSDAKDAAAQDIELGNRIAFYLQRCANPPTAPTSPTPPAATGAKPDSAKADTGARSGRGAPGGLSFFAVQVAAVRAAAAADDVMRSLKAQGYAARVSRDADGYLKVRVGRFTTRAEAERLAREVKRKVGGTPFVVEEQ